jgi:uncharacterized phiE125 gp8 family phage protein
MVTVVAGQANTVGVDIIDPQSTSGGGGVETGTVEVYLVQRRGAEEGKYWDASAGDWSATAAAAGSSADASHPVVHESQGHWTCSIAAEAWEIGAAYRLYGVLDGGVYVSHSIDVLCIGSVAAWSGGVGSWPVSLAELKAHLRIDADDATEDLLLDAYLGAATRWAEHYNGRKFLTQTCVDVFDRFPSVIRPQGAPLIAVTSLSYLDSGGQAQTLSATQYAVDAVTEPGRIVPAYGTAWPATRDELNAVTLTYTAGYGADGSSVPEHVRNAILLLAGDLYENREDIIEGHIVTTIPTGVRALLGIDRLVHV